MPWRCVSLAAIPTHWAGSGLGTCTCCRHTFSWLCDRCFDWSELVRRGGGLCQCAWYREASGFPLSWSASLAEVGLLLHCLRERKGVVMSWQGLPDWGPIICSTAMWTCSRVKTALDMSLEQQSCVFFSFKWNESLVFSLLWSVFERYQIEHFSFSIWFFFGHD